MKKILPDDKPKAQAEPMPETDFSKGVRGKHYEKYRASVITVRIDGGVAKRVAEPQRKLGTATRIERTPKPARRVRVR